MRRAFKTIFYIRGNYVNKSGQSSIMIRLCLDRDRLCIGTTGITIVSVSAFTYCHKKRGCVKSPF
jgi:hypothetical protein